ncbi:hypothetical protein BBM38_23680 [Vibrio parahaemolyticus]|uniref:hypothetical protein n=1 Tax=Vibrio parahaemolyticus TaxID=670 RepID=UPI00084A703D|nr:hypothetical protein [Vibrio parahaemolyticus]ODZ29296.1 hypothetical protein BBM38_23680 [Vibrio parahaemolyticus]ODZ38485.1 hypothetical protein BBM37_08200 [Vibrio parahaemolyticus]
MLSNDEKTTLNFKKSTISAYLEDLISSSTGDPVEVNIINDDMFNEDDRALLLDGLEDSETNQNTFKIIHKLIQLGLPVDYIVKITDCSESTVLGVRAAFVSVALCAANGIHNVPEFYYLPTLEEVKNHRQ